MFVHCVYVLYIYIYKNKRQIYVKQIKRWVIKIKLNEISMKIKNMNEKCKRKKIKILKETEFFYC